VCVEALLSAVDAHPDPRAAVARFTEDVQRALEETLRRQRWWSREDPCETARDLIFLQAARELAVAKSFLDEHPPARVFPSHSAYLDFRAGEFQLPGYVFAGDYYEMIALLSGFPLSLLVTPAPTPAPTLEPGLEPGLEAAEDAVLEPGSEAWDPGRREGRASQDTADEV